MENTREEGSVLTVTCIFSPELLLRLIKRVSAEVEDSCGKLLACRRRGTRRTLIELFSSWCNSKANCNTNHKVIVIYSLSTKGKKLKEDINQNRQLFCLNLFIT